MMWKIVLPVLAAVFAVGITGGLPGGIPGGLPGGLPGGFQDIDINDVDARQALHFAVIKHNKHSNDPYLSKVAAVIRVQRQLVSGYRYLIHVKMAKTSCRKDAPQVGCEIYENPHKARHYYCTFIVWSQPWLDSWVINEKC